MGEEKLQNSAIAGTLAIDLGSTTTVVAFAAAGQRNPRLLDLPPISQRVGEVPSLLWLSDESPLLGQQVLDAGLADQDDPRLARDFKRHIGRTEIDSQDKGSQVKDDQAARAGALLLKGIWSLLPQQLRVERLVLTAPVETYRSYRSWLLEACAALPVEEIALVDEPTAAALGAGLPPGARLLVVDLGGSTLDLALVALQGGEGKAAPIAQLLRLGGRQLGESSRQRLRNADVLGKAGLRLGGRDIDRWIAAACCPEAPLTPALLNAAERLKCRLSDPELAEQTVLEETPTGGSNQPLRLSRRQLEVLLEERGLADALRQLLEATLTGGRRHGCDLSELDAVVAVGGGAQLPWLRRWLEEHTAPAPLFTPPPVEAVALGALSLTPGVAIRDVLQHGVSLRTWDQRSQQHRWHPLFVAGQPWPSPQPFELVLAASCDGQTELELLLGEPAAERRFSVIEVNGVPTLQREEEGDLRHQPWPDSAAPLPLDPPGRAGEDCLRLSLRVDADARLQAEVTDCRTGRRLPDRQLGQVR